ncbi:patatin-like phospholipase family protein [Thiovibrio frasassiensis]|uniref:Patatin-like phospholipase family protein n=1 Tax=Thiovibrio frasassiensis TaxID=2984131 RepID=A0A9X4MGH3_9BACT|nr:patatin-like phospholipase family protein [Thiovibrio frasassiensis]MDG4475465.1 patatin-like phospholipase family protein [Thiovibrio frasassiensis]
MGCYKLAVAISGAVSLGSYEAGVMYEIIKAIGQHNLNPDTLPEDRIEIDVITGASAGGMTAAITAQKLLFESNNLEGAFVNHLYKPWVEEVDLMKLLQIGPKDRPDLSLLSSELILDISKKYLDDRYSSSAPTSPKKHAAAADTILLGLAMSNLNGVDYGMEMRSFQNIASDDPASQNKFIYTRHQDRFVREVKANPACDMQSFWDPIRKAAVACGAFPFAFRVQGIERSQTDEAYLGAEPFGFKKLFAYTDGGAFQNEPLGMAKKLVNQIDTAHLNHEKRFYLYISPNPKKRSSLNDKFTAETANYLATGKALVSAFYTQARFHDWIMTANTNKDVEIFDHRAEALQGLLTQSPEKLGEFASVADALLNALYAGTLGTNQGETQEAALARLKHQFDKEYKALLSTLEQKGINQDAALTWLKAVLVLEKAANLGDRDIMTVYNVTADADEVAGEKLAAFGGFFDQKYRDFDYTIGRQKARKLLDMLKSQAGNNSNLPLTNFAYSEVIKEPDTTLANVTVNDLPKEKRLALKAAVVERYKTLIDISVKGPIKHFLVKFFGKIAVSILLGELLQLNDDTPPKGQEDDDRL